MNISKKRSARGIKKHIRGIQRLAKNAHHMKMEESADRGYILEYVLSCIPYIHDNSRILEFDGGVVYSDLIIDKKGGNVEFATKKGRLERNNPITYEFDITQEVLDEKFDVIIATQVISSFVDPLKIMRQLKEMLAPSGVLIVTASGPAYPKIKGQISFYSKEGLTIIGREVFGVRNVRNVRSYGDFLSAICILDYLSNEIMDEKIYDENYKHEVINGIVCINDK